MHNIIIGYLFQHGECPLPGIGKFRVRHIPASYDITKKLMDPPKEQIQFEEDAALSSGHLIETISFNKGVNKDTARNLLDGYLSHIKAELQNSGEVIFDTLGTLNKNEEGSIYFNTKETNVFTRPLYAEKVREGNHQILVGDSTVDSDAYEHRGSDQKGKKNLQWLTTAIIIALVTIAIGFTHFYNHPFGLNSIGNQQKIKLVEPPLTHE